MSVCRFYYQNLLADPAQISVYSARPGMVGMPVANAAGEHQGG